MKLVRSLSLALLTFFAATALSSCILHCDRCSKKKAAREAAALQAAQPESVAAPSQY